MTRVRLDWVLEPVRDTVPLEELRGQKVFHYSIPFLDEFGDGALQNGAEIESAKQRILGGELLISRLNPRKSRVVMTVPHQVLAVCSGEFVVLRPRAGVLAEFMRYLLASEAVRAPLASQVRSVTRSQQRVEPSAITKMWLDIPSLDDQRRIVEYLDTETARIDGLISEQKHLIAVLNERRRASVFDAVTGRSVAGQRRGGVPWVADIPAHWTAARLTSVARLGSGHTPARSRPELWQECTIPWVTTGEVWQVRSDVQEVLTETRECISEAGVRESAAVVHPAGTVVLCRTAASAGYSALMGSDMATSQDFATWTCGPPLRPRFLLHCLRAMRPDLLGRLAMGSTHRTIYMPEIRSLVVPLPPVDEQDAILKELDRTLSQLDTVRTELELQTSLLDEHRQALITAAVTGGLDAVGRVA